MASIQGSFGGFFFSLKEFEIVIYLHRTLFQISNESRFNQSDDERALGAQKSLNRSIMHAPNFRYAEFQSLQPHLVGQSIAVSSV